jgi:hypothetical protein
VVQFETAPLPSFQHAGAFEKLGICGSLIDDQRLITNDEQRSAA